MRYSRRRLSSVRLLLATLGLIALGSFGRTVSTQQDGQFIRYSDDGNRLHIVPTLDVLSRIPTVRRGLAGADEGVVQGNATVYPSPYSQLPLIDHGDPEIANARVQAVYWNTSVANATATSLGYATVKDQINAFLNAFADGVNWRDTATADYTIIQQYGSHATIAPTLGNTALYVDAQTSTSSITDLQIRQYLAGRFTAGALSPTTNTLYAVFLPPGMAVDGGGGQFSCSVFCGYHSWFTYNGSRIIYAAMPYLNCNACRFVSGGTVADQLTVVLSHEVREAVTDSFNSWYDANGDEADDKCNSTHLYQMSNGGFWVQPEWSNGGTVTASGFTATYPGPGCVVPSTPAVVAIPSAPTGLTASTGTSSTINLSWTASSGATSYVVKRSTISGAEVTIAAGVAGTTYADSGLPSGTRYFYVVAATNASGTSGNSSEASAVTSVIAGTPSAPTSLTATAASTSQINLSWAASSGATSYVVRRSTSSGTEATIASAVTGTTFADTGLAAATQYFYVVAASNASGTGPNSTEVSAVTAGTPGQPSAPSPPSGLSATATGSRIDLSWTASSGATSYVVRRGTTSGGESTIATGVTTNAYADTGLNTGTYYYQVQAVNANGTSGNSNEATATVAASSFRVADYDGDGKADPVVFRPSSGAWFFLKSSTAFANGSGFTWGQPTDSPIVGDFDGDGKSDLGVFRASTREWFVLLSGSGFVNGVGYQWGAAGDVPVPGDYDGDGKTDLAVFRPSTGEWFYKTSSSGYTSAFGYKWGAAGDTAVPGDFDGDRKADLVVFRPTTGEWFIKTSSSGYTAGLGYQVGNAGDTPVVGDFDGDGRMDLTTYRPSTGRWTILTSGSNYGSTSTYTWGAVGDVPVVGDYDGDGKTDIAVYRATSGAWFILRSSSGFTSGVGYTWGAAGDIPIPR